MDRTKPGILIIGGPETGYSLMFRKSNTDDLNYVSSDLAPCHKNIILAVKQALTLALQFDIPEENVNIDASIEMRHEAQSLVFAALLKRAGYDADEINEYINAPEEVSMEEHVIETLMEIDANPNIKKDVSSSSGMVEFCTAWKRTAPWSKEKTRIYKNLHSAKKLARKLHILFGFTPWEYWGANPDDLYRGCRRQRCLVMNECGGTLLEHFTRRQSSLPPLEYLRVMRRAVDAWTVVDDIELPEPLAESKYGRKDGS